MPEEPSVDRASCLINYPVILSSVILSSCQPVSHPWLREELREWKTGQKTFQGLTGSSGEEELSAEEFALK